MKRRHRWYDGFTTDAERDARADELEDETSEQLIREQETRDQQAPRWEQEDGVQWVIGGGAAVDAWERD